jgi:hypothetical protein
MVLRGAAWIAAAPLRHGRIKSITRLVEAGAVVLGIRRSRRRDDTGRSSLAVARLCDGAVAILEAVLLSRPRIPLLAARGGANEKLPARDARSIRGRRDDAKAVGLAGVGAFWPGSSSTSPTTHREPPACCPFATFVALFFVISVGVPEYAQVRE